MQIISHPCCTAVTIATQISAIESRSQRFESRLSCLVDFQPAKGKALSIQSYLHIQLDRPSTEWTRDDPSWHWQQPSPAASRGNAAQLPDLAEDALVVDRVKAFADDVQLVGDGVGTGIWDRLACVDEHVHNGSQLIHEAT